MASTTVADESVRKVEYIQGFRISVALLLYTHSIYEYLDGVLYIWMIEVMHLGECYLTGQRALHIWMHVT